MRVWWESTQPFSLPPLPTTPGDNCRLAVLTIINPDKNGEGEGMGGHGHFALPLFISFFFIWREKCVSDNRGPWARKMTKIAYENSAAEPCAQSDLLGTEDR